MEDTVLYTEIMNRMPVFSLQRLVRDMKNYDMEMESFDDGNINWYNTLINGEFCVTDDGTELMSTIDVGHDYKKDGVYYTEIDPDTYRLLQLMNAHPVYHPIITRTLLLPSHKLGYSYCRPKNTTIRRVEDPSTVLDLIGEMRELCPNFDLRFIYNRVITLCYDDGRHNSGCELVTIGESYYNSDELLDSIVDHYVYGHHDVIGKAVKLNIQ